MDERLTNNVWGTKVLSGVTNGLSHHYSVTSESVNKKRSKKEEERTVSERLRDNEEKTTTWLEWAKR